MSEAGFFLAIALGSAAACGGLSLALWRAFRRPQPVAIKILTGFILAVTGTLTLLAGACGMTWLFER